MRRFLNPQHSPNSQRKHHQQSLKKVQFMNKKCMAVTTYIQKKFIHFEIPIYTNNNIPFQLFSILKINFFNNSKYVLTLFSCHFFRWIKPILHFQDQPHFGGLVVKVLQKVGTKGKILTKKLVHLVDQLQHK